MGVPFCCRPEHGRPARGFCGVVFDELAAHELSLAGPAVAGFFVVGGSFGVR